MYFLDASNILWYEDKSKSIKKICKIDEIVATYSYNKIDVIIDGEKKYIRYGYICLPRKNKLARIPVHTYIYPSYDNATLLLENNTYIIRSFYGKLNTGISDKHVITKMQSDRSNEYEHDEMNNLKIFVYYNKIIGNCPFIYYENMYILYETEHILCSTTSYCEDIKGLTYEYIGIGYIKTEEGIFSLSNAEHLPLQYDNIHPNLFNAIAEKDGEYYIDNKLVTDKLKDFNFGYNRQIKSARNI